MTGEVGVGGTLHMSCRCWGVLCLVCLWCLKKGAQVEACMRLLHRVCLASHAMSVSGPHDLAR